MESLLILIPIAAVFALITAYVLAEEILEQDTGNERMVEISDAVKQGAMAYMNRQYRTITVVAIIITVVFLFVTLASWNNGAALWWWTTVGFVVGAFFSALSGYIGMNVAVRTNVRVAQAARESLPQALKIAFNGGAVSGLAVAGLALLGVASFFYTFHMILGLENPVEPLVGFAFGASLISLFARVGGGIYTKAADVGADLVGKVEAGIPEDDPRNPATIADNVGDNVGDVAGMGADLFGSYVATVLAAMVLGNYVIRDMLEVGNITVLDDGFGGISPILVPLIIAGLGILFSIAGTWLISIKNEGSKEPEVQAALNRGNWGSIVLTGIASYFVIDLILPETLQMGFFGEGIKEIDSFRVFGAVLVGLFVGGAISFFTEYYTGLGKKPVMDIVQKSSTGHATNVIAGLATGMLSTFAPILLFAGAIWGAYELAGFYGVSIAASAMMATTAMQLAIDAFGPIADNAGGIAEMSGLPKEVREKTDILDSVGNTTAATGKGFAIASAALTALALFAAYVTFTKIDGINIFKADVLAALFIGGMIPVVFSALAMNSVGKAAMEMVKEVRRQFKEIPGIMEGTGKPEYAKCVEISTKAAIREMMLPGAITIITPIIVGFAMGMEPLGAYMAGVTVSGVLWAIFQNNAGGAWDNAKKSFEAGVMIDGEMTYKGSEAHKAAVTGDTVGDPFKDTSGPSMNILIKLTCLVGLVIAPLLYQYWVGDGEHLEMDASATEASVVGGDDLALIDGNTLSGVLVVTEDNADFIWRGKKVTGRHNGKVSGEGEVSIENNLVTRGKIAVDMTSISVDDVKDEESNAKLTNHLKSDDFFAVKEFPVSYVVINSSSDNGDGTYSFSGTLTLKGIEGLVSGTYTIEQAGGDYTELNGGFEFDRSKFDVRYGSGSFFEDLGDRMIYDEVNISFSLKS